MSHLVIIDWKSGWKRKDAHHQMAGYSLAVQSQHGPYETITTVVVWLRDMEIDVETWDDAKLKAWREQFAEKMSEIGKKYAPGEHCGFCPHRSTCIAYRDHVAGACLAIAERPTESMTPELLVSLYDRSLMLQKALDAYREALRSNLEQGALTLPDGRKLGFKEETREEIDARIAWPVLRACGLGDLELGKIVKVVKGRMLDVIADATPKGKGAAKKDLLKKLADAGAVTETVVRKIGVIKE